MDILREIEGGGRGIAVSLVLKNALVFERFVSISSEIGACRRW